MDVWSSHFKYTFIVYNDDSKKKHDFVYIEQKKTFHLNFMEHNFYIKIVNIEKCEKLSDIVENTLTKYIVKLNFNL